MLVLLLVGPACSTVRVVRLDTGGAAPIMHTAHEADGTTVVALDDGAFGAIVASLARDVRPSLHPLRDARRRFGVPDRSGVYAYERRGQRLIPVDERADGPRLMMAYAGDVLTRDYGRWCARKQQPGDCLRLLDEGPLLASDGKYTLAMAIAMDSVWEETAGALRDMADPQALMATVTASISMYLLLWALPEPVSKGVAALVTATAIAYLGVDTVWRLLDGWIALVRQVDQASTFEQLSTAGEAYGEVLGANAARIFVMLATAGGSGGASRTQKHHIATNKNEVSTVRGGPWTPEFRRLFKRAGMELKDPENIIQVRGHKGPHPQEYHELVFERLQSATVGCRQVAACRKALTTELQRLASEAATRGTEINRLLTRGR